MINPGNTHTYLVQTGEPRHRMAEGIGCNLLLSNQGDLPALSQRGKWQQVLDALDDLQVGWMRVGIIPTAKDGSWDDRRQVWNFRHRHFQTLKAIGQWANRRGVRLMFDPFATPDSFRRQGAHFADDPGSTPGN